jgi:hypothetical protein
VLEVSQYLTSNYTTSPKHKNRHEGQWNRIEGPATNTCRYTHLIFDKGTQNNENSFFHKCFMQRTETKSMSSPSMSINSKWIKDLNIRPDTFKLVKKRTRNTLEQVSIGNNFLIRTQMSQQLRKKIDKWDYVVRIFCGIGFELKASCLLGRQSTT